jgi:hypothetical protein
VVKRALLFFLFVVFCAAFFFYYWKGGLIAMSTTDMLSTAGAFLDDIGAGRIDSAYARTTNNFRARHSLTQFRALIDEQPLLKEPAARQLGDYDLKTRHHIQGNATYRCVLQAAKTSLPVKLVLTTEQAEWRIEDFAPGAKD